MSGTPPSLSSEDLAQIERWHAEALSTPPDRHRWAKLIADLGLACIQEQRGHHDPTLPEGMDAPFAAVFALLGFLNAHEFIKTGGMLFPIMRLATAMHDVAEGRRSKLFERTYKGRKRMSAIRAIIMADAARALNELMLSGMEERAAAIRVASAVKSGRLVGFSKCTARTVEGWRDRLNEGAGEVSPDALARYLAELPPEVGDTHRSRANWLLTELRLSNGLRYG